jgi:hypothetical protein
MEFRPSAAALPPVAVKISSFPAINLHSLWPIKAQYTKSGKPKPKAQNLA